MFEYRKRLPELSDFYDSMRSLMVQIGTFPHSYNGINSHAIFDTWHTPFVLIFIKHGFGDVLSIPINNSFTFTIKGNQQYTEFLDYFEIKNRSKGQFHIGKFTENLATQIPDNYHVTDSSRKIIYSYDPIDRDSNGIYPIGTKKWDEINALRHAKGLPDSGHRTAMNLEKTRNLYPDVYKIIRNMDISIVYGNTPNNRTSLIATGNFSHN